MAKPGGVAKPWLTRPVQSLPQHKPLLLQNGAGHIANPVQVPKTVVQPRQRHSAEELDAMRNKGICFKCKGKYFRGNVCPLKELQILTVVDGLELEVLEDDLTT